MNATGKQAGVWSLRLREPRFWRRLLIVAAALVVALSAVPAIFPEILLLAPRELRNAAGPAASLAPHNSMWTFALLAAVNGFAAVLCMQAARERRLSPLTAAYAVLFAVVSALIAAGEAFLGSVGEAAVNPAVFLQFTERGYHAFRMVMLGVTVPLWWITLWSVWQRVKRRPLGAPPAPRAG